ncbi:MAG: hypothetical protein OEW68_10085 [Gammaproteobacteria bacterium]|nr:hypothetical protein [Gammaproteobacteria bacterium]MDH4315175.1 hypothetical protein [Gammaproteobacteria bacterium]MDH5216000.1 hypothetical protein [Gammaproteobacteria bacterium]
MNRISIVVFLLVAFQLVACAAQSGNDRLTVVDSPSAARDLDTNRNAAGGEPVLGPGLQRLVDLAKSNLAVVLHVETSEIETVSAGYVTWPDSALGCPEPGYEYMQVLTNGSLIRLRAGKQIYQYHSGGNQPPFRCEHPDPIVPPPYTPGEA